MQHRYALVRSVKHHMRNVRGFTYLMQLRLAQAKAGRQHEQSGGE